MILDRNESYWLLTEELLALTRTLGATDLSTYPDYGELKKALAQYVGVPADHVLVTPGSDAAIEHIARVFAGKGGEVLLPVPTFYGYETILDRVETRITPLIYTEKNGQFFFPQSETVSACESKSARILFLCHPNNPLGSTLTRENMTVVMEATRAHSLMVVSDEAYAEFSQSESLLSYLRDRPNLIILRTLSKAFGLAGARVGYVLAQPQVIQTLERQLLPWPIAHASVSAALALLERREVVASRRAVLIQNHGHVTSALRALPGVTVYDTHTNFVLVRVSDARQVHSELSRQGIRVALGEPMTRFPEAQQLLHNTLRIAVPSPIDFPRFMDAFTHTLDVGSMVK